MKRTILSVHKESSWSEYRKVKHDETPSLQGMEIDIVTIEPTILGDEWMYVCGYIQLNIINIPYRICIRGVQLL